MDFNTIVVYLGCIIFLFLIGRIFILPLKFIFKLIGNSILGGILIFVVNMIGNLFNFHIGLNIGTAFITGILGIPRSYIINYFTNFIMIFINKSFTTNYLTQAIYLKKINSFDNFYSLIYNYIK